MAKRKRSVNDAPGPPRGRKAKALPAPSSPSFNPSQPVEPPVPTYPYNSETGIPITEVKPNYELLEQRLPFKENFSLSHSLARSRNKWLSGAMFTKYWTRPPRGRKLQEGEVNAREKMSKLCECIMVIGPHIFETKLFIVKDDPADAVPDSKPEDEQKASVAPSQQDAPSTAPVTPNQIVNTAPANLQVPSTLPASNQPLIVAPPALPAPSATPKAAPASNTISLPPSTPASPVVNTLKAAPAPISSPNPPALASSASVETPVIQKTSASTSSSVNSTPTVRNEQQRPALSATSTPSKPSASLPDKVAGVPSPKSATTAAAISKPTVGSIPAAQPKPNKPATAPIGQLPAHTTPAKPPASTNSITSNPENVQTILKLQAIARIDKSLNSLMKIVASGSASHQQITEFQGYINRVRMIDLEDIPKYFTPEGPKFPPDMQFRKPPPSTPGPSGPTGLPGPATTSPISRNTPIAPNRVAPRPGTNPALSPVVPSQPLIQPNPIGLTPGKRGLNALKTKPPKPPKPVKPPKEKKAKEPKKKDTEGKTGWGKKKKDPTKPKSSYVSKKQQKKVTIVFEFKDNPADRYIIPKNSMIEILPTNEVLVSFFLTFPEGGRFATSKDTGLSGIKMEHIKTEGGEEDGGMEAPETPRAAISITGEEHHTPPTGDELFYPLTITIRDIPVKSLPLLERCVHKPHDVYQNMQNTIDTGKRAKDWWVWFEIDRRDEDLLEQLIQPAKPPENMFVPARVRVYKSKKKNKHSGEPDEDEKKNGELIKIEDDEMDVDEDEDSAKKETAVKASGDATVTDVQDAGTKANVNDTSSAAVSREKSEEKKLTVVALPATSVAL